MILYGLCCDNRCLICVFNDVTLVFVYSLTVLGEHQLCHLWSTTLNTTNNYGITPLQHCTLANCPQRWRHSDLTSTPGSQSSTIFAITLTWFPRSAAELLAAVPNHTHLIFSQNRDGSIRWCQFACDHCNFLDKISTESMRHACRSTASESGHARALEAAS